MRVCVLWILKENIQTDFFIFMHLRRVELKGTSLCFMCPNIVIIREDKKSSVSYLSLDMTEWKQHLHGHGYRVCLFFPLNPRYYSAKLNESRKPHKKTHTVAAQSSLASFFFKLGTLSFTVFPFIVVVTACCQPPLPLLLPLCVAWRGGFIPRLQIQWWHWHRWSEVFS